MLMMNHTSGVGANPTPGIPYFNPYCSVQAVPCGNYNQRLYNNNNQQFIRQMLQPSALSYDAWKQQCGIMPRSVEEEDYYLNLYNTSVLPQQRQQAFNQQRFNFYNNIHAQTTMPMPWGSPYAYQNPYIYGYDKTRDAYEYNRALCGAVPRIMDMQKAMSQSEFLKQQEVSRKNQVTIIKKITAIGLKHAKVKDEDISKRLNKIDEQTKPQKINPVLGFWKKDEETKVNNPRAFKFTISVIEGGKEKVVTKVAVPHKGNISIDYNDDYKYQVLKNLKDITYVTTMNKAVHDQFVENIEKFKNMSLVEFLNDHGGLLVADAMDREFVNKFRNNMFNYNHSSYMDQIANHSQYKNCSGTAASFYCTSLSQNPQTGMIKDCAINPPRQPMMKLNFVDYLNFLDNSQPISDEEYQKYLKLANGNEFEAKSLTLYKSFHPEFDVESYLKLNGNDPNNRLSIVENDRLIKFYNAMIDRRPELRNGRIGAV